MHKLKEPAAETKTAVAAEPGTGVPTGPATSIATSIATGPATGLATGLAPEAPTETVTGHAFDPTTDPDPSGDPAMTPLRPFRPLVFGETLFDHFPQETRVLGGAPFHVAWHLHGFKAVPLLVTRIGKDSPAREILDRMGEWGMDFRGVQVHPDRPTGKVTVELERGEARFRIEAHQAYDEIEAGKLPPPGVLADADLLYHGTLAMRESVSREALAHLRETAGAPVLVDVNLREPWWSTDTVAWALDGADWAKMNGHEAAILAGSSARSPREILDAAARIRDRHRTEHLVVTLGSGGAVGLTSGGVVRHDAPEVTDLADTVGAGDAFSAVVALGIHFAWPMDLILRRATDFAADICRIRGATVDDPALYARHLRSWNHEAR
jgi:fructokinase